MATTFEKVEMETEMGQFLMDLLLFLSFHSTARTLSTSNPTFAYGFTEAVKKSFVLLSEDEQGRIIRGLIADNVDGQCDADGNECEYEWIVRILFEALGDRDLVGTISPIGTVASFMALYHNEKVVRWEHWSAVASILGSPPQPAEN